MASRRPRRSGFMRVRQPATTSYIETSGLATIATTTATSYLLLLASDGPNKALVTDLSAVAQVENNSRILKRGSFMQFNLIANSAPAVVNLWVWLNKKGSITPPTNGYDFSLAPVTEDNAQLREQTVVYRRVSLSTTDFVTVRLPLGSRRNNYLTDPASALTLVVHNTSGASTISFTAYGRIKTLEG